MAKLLADIGGTYMRLALSEDGKSFVRDPQKIKTENFRSSEEALLSFVQTEHYNPSDIDMIAIAQSGQNKWLIDATSVSHIFPKAQLELVNDFEANAMGLVSPTPDELMHLAGAKTLPDATRPRAVIGSGTGLGLAYIAPNGPNGYVQATHGGHMLPALVGQEQIDLFVDLQYFKTDKTIPIYEDALSGNGLMNIYKILSGRRHLDCEYHDTHHMLAEGRNNPLVQMALKYYHEILGQFAHQAVAFGAAYGGLFLTGGITDRLMGHNLFDTTAFLAGFYQNTVPVVLNDIKSTPVFWVKDEFISLKGLLTPS